ncbi:hypothetical protein HZC09_00645 [Candidatus Micrarchaeota archaeon]|nr:hypothetical protein [Candidatus Micrarchaeota archaeon]
MEKASEPFRILYAGKDETYYQNLQAETKKIGVKAKWFRRPIAQDALALLKQMQFGVVLAEQYLKIPEKPIWLSEEEMLEWFHEGHQLYDVQCFGYNLGQNPLSTSRENGRVLLLFAKHVLGVTPIHLVASSAQNHLEADARKFFKDGPIDKVTEYILSVAREKGHLPDGK